MSSFIFSRITLIVLLNQIGVIYGATRFTNSSVDKSRLSIAVSQLHTCLKESTSPQVLWNMYYWQRGGRAGDLAESDRDMGNMLLFPNPSLDMIFDDSTIERVREMWTETHGDVTAIESFLHFEDREGDVEEEDDT
jgi:Rab proteins geranylgeranyltransferase component A